MAKKNFFSLPAMENVFTEESVGGMIGRIQTNINECETQEALDEFETRIVDEIEKYNANYGALVDLAEKYDTDQIDKEEMIRGMRPFLENIKEQCTAFGLAIAEEPSLSEDETSLLKGYLIAIRNMVGEKRAALTNVDENDDTNVLAGEDNDNDEEEQEDGIVSESFSLRKLSRFLKPAYEAEGDEDEDEDAEEDEDEDEEEVDEDEVDDEDTDEDEDEEEAADAAAEESFRNLFR